MLKNHIALIITISIILLISSCAKEGPDGPQGIAGPAYTGTISGHVILYDQYGNRILKNLDSVAIILGSNSVPGIDDTISRPDTTGYYVYNTIVTGQYYISAFDTSYGIPGSGYGSTINNFEFVSGNLNLDIKLSAIPTFSLSFTANQDTITQNDTLVLNYTADEQVRSCVIFVNNTASTAAGENYILSYTKNIPANSTQMSVVINGQELYDAGLAHDTKVYYTVFSHALNDQSSYEDPTTGKTVYTAVSYPSIDSTYVP